MRTWFRKPRSRAGKAKSPSRNARPAVETLEDRRLLAAPALSTIFGTAIPPGQPIGINVTANKNLYIPMTSVDRDGNALNYSVTSNNPSLLASVEPVTNPFLKVHVTAVDANNQPFQGDLLFQLLRDVAPVAVDRIAGMASSGFYDNLVFHRLIQGFVIQGGDPNGDGSGGPPGPGAPDPRFQFDDEFNTQALFDGTAQLALANSGMDTNGSQFFITFGPQRFLDYNYTLFGQLVSGYDLLRKLATLPTSGNDAPVHKPVITSAQVVSDNADAVLAVRWTGGPTTSSLTLTIDDGTGNKSQRVINIKANADDTNDPPILNTSTLTNLVTPADTPVKLTPTAVDPDGGGLTFTVRVLPGSDNLTHGHATDNGDGTFTVTPDAGFTGQLPVIVGVKQAGATARGSTVSPTGDPNDIRIFDTQKIVVAVGDAGFKDSAATPVTADEGTPALNVPVASFHYNDALATAADFSAQILWGDGTHLSSGVITVDPQDPTHFVVSGTNTYADGGRYPIDVTITHQLTGGTPGAVLRVRTAATVSDAALSGTSAAITVPSGVVATNVKVATFQDLGGPEAVAHYSALINWGDGTPYSYGTITLSGSTFTVTASHTFAGPGRFGILVTIQDRGGSMAIATSSAVVGTPNQRFVSQAYRDVLGRFPDAQGLADFTRYLDQGIATRFDVAARLLNSQEYRTDVVAGFYQVILKRQPDSGGLSSNLQFLNSGGSSEALEAMFFGTGEYFALHGSTNASFLDALYLDILGRHVDQAGLSGWSNALAHGTTRTQVAMALLQSKESDTLEVQALYRTALKRPADSGGLSTYVPALQRGISNEYILALLMASGEYYNKA